MSREQEPQQPSSTGAGATSKSFLRGIAPVLFAVAGGSFFFGGKVISVAAKTDRLIAEMGGIGLALIFGALGLWAKTTGEDDEPDQDADS